MSAGALRGIVLALVLAGAPCLGPGAAGAPADAGRGHMSTLAAAPAPGDGPGDAYRVDSYVIGAGGGHSSAGILELTGTAGQPDAGSGVPATGGRFAVAGGFWPAVAAPALRPDPVFADGFEQ